MKRLTLLFVILATPALFAQRQSVNPGINKSYDSPDVNEFVGRFEREGRDAFDHRDAVVKACGIKRGMAIADIGAGTGLFTRMFSPLAGNDGKVYAVDIAESFVRHIQRSAAGEGLTNVAGIVCTQDSVNLPPNSIDLAFICDTYHHFEFPQKTMRSIHRALKPGGHVVLVEFHRIKGTSSDWVLGHVRAGQDVFTKEIVAAGFRQIEEKQGLLDESYFLRFERVCDAEIGEADKDENGLLAHRVVSPYQQGETRIRVLLPDDVGTQRYPVVYVLPVEAGEGTRYGDGLLEIKRHDLHNKFGVIFVEPTFSELPWYADHPTHTTTSQESHFLFVVVPFIENTYPAVAQRDGRLLLGFSKSGWGAWSLLLRQPETFGKACAWDAPLMMTQVGSYGSGDIFGTQANFQKYCISDLIRARAEHLQGEKRLILGGFGNFRTQHQQAHALLDEANVAHVYRDGPQRKHDWGSGWVAEAVADLLKSDVH